MVWLGSQEVASRISNVLRPVHLFLACFLPSAMATIYLMLHPHAVYLMDYAGFRTTHTCRILFASSLEHAKLFPDLNKRSIRFMTRLMERSGLGARGEDMCASDAPLHWNAPILHH
ncbi:hypothetical protein ZWY2020_005742 [Hordeum vulgare]|nr:hypothetical protein ZWY2020_005742 [Hordeum vulgare]